MGKQPKQPKQPKQGKHVIVFTMNSGYPCFAEDEEGNPRLFASEKEAEAAGWAMDISGQWPFVVVEID